MADALSSLTGEVQVDIYFKYLCHRRLFITGFPLLAPFRIPKETGLKIVKLSPLIASPSMNKLKNSFPFL